MLTVSLRKLRQVDKTLPVLGQESRHVYERRDTFGTSCRSLRCDNAAHAVADHDGRFGIGRQHLTNTACVAIQADLARRRVVVAHPRQVERLHYMASLLQRFNQWQPNPCARTPSLPQHKSPPSFLLSFSPP